MRGEGGCWSSSLELVCGRCVCEKLATLSFSTAHCTEVELMSAGTRTSVSDVFLPVLGIQGDGIKWFRHNVTQRTVGRPDVVICDGDVRGSSQF